MQTIANVVHLFELPIDFGHTLEREYYNVRFLNNFLHMFADLLLFIVLTKGDMVDINRFDHGNNLSRFTSLIHTHIYEVE